MAPERHATQREGGNSPVVQWLGLEVFTAGAWVQSLGRELGSSEVSGVAKKKKAEGGKGRGRERRTVPVEVWDKPEGDDLVPCVSSHLRTDRLGKSQWMPKRTSVDDQTPEVFDPLSPCL